ncbi:hypothetical protein [Photobacterium atrarenae]|uniref:DUF3570 domain-containing protein n=1 Tax=Photobacterium atrarenae TaxID=865757 RepID=A0ABY5GLJ9_9GAMM|nr:hypothetical protein [Photobacterium atrarenae]UTV30122.1 hypothetical protein NNL38_16175 [Photobacterium atrarenae]
MTALAGENVWFQNSLSRLIPLPILQQTQRRIHSGIRLQKTLDAQVVVFSLTLSCPIWAAPIATETPSQSAHADKNLPDNESSDWVDWLDDTQVSIAGTVHDYSSNIDHYIGKEDGEDPLDNQSYLRLRQRLRYGHREYLDGDTNIYFRLDLPHTEKNWKLIFDTDPDDFDRLEDKERGISNRSDDGLGRAVGGVRLEGRKLGSWKPNFDIGLKLKLPLDPFTRADIQRVDQISRHWTSRLKQEVFYYHTKGPGVVTTIDFYFAQEPDISTLLKLSTNLQYLDTDNNWEYVQQVQMLDRISHNSLMTYSLGISADSRPTYAITNAWVTASWKHRFYKNWAYLTITPELNFQDEFSYKINPGIMLELALYFSAKRKIDHIKQTIPVPE